MSTTGAFAGAGFAIEDGDAVRLDTVDGCEWDWGLVGHGRLFQTGSDNIWVSDTATSVTNAIKAHRLFF
jgi:hypothetical protein